MSNFWKKKPCELFFKSLFEIQVSIRQISSKRCGLFSSNSTKLTKVEVILLSLRCMIQGRIQTTSTYASAEATSGVVKLLKKIPEYPFSAADQKDWDVFGQGMPWLFCRTCRMSLHACHVVKTILPRNIRKFSNIQENIWKFRDYTTCLIFKCLQNSAKCTGWTDYRLCFTAIVLTLHCWNILIIFKQISVLPFLQEDFTVCFACFQFRWKWRAHILLRWIGKQPRG